MSLATCVGEVIDLVDGKSLRIYQAVGQVEIDVRLSTVADASWTHWSCATIDGVDRWRCTLRDIGSIVLEEKIEIALRERVVLFKDSHDVHWLVESSLGYVIQRLDTSRSD